MAAWILEMNTRTINPSVHSLKLLWRLFINPVLKLGPIVLAHPIKNPNHLVRDIHDVGLGSSAILGTAGDPWLSVPVFQQVWPYRFFIRGLLLTFFSLSSQYKSALLVIA